MASDNRAVPALGRAAGMNPAEMVAAMNAKAKTLKLEHTHSKIRSGSTPTTPRPHATWLGLLKAVMHNETITAITQKAHYVAHPVGRLGWAIEYNNTNVVARGGRYQVITGKTGYTDLALLCLAMRSR